MGLRGAGGARPGNVKQSFSHGRTKNVVVETKRKRVVVPKPGGQSLRARALRVVSDPSRRPAGISDAEMDRRLKAVQAAKAREVEEAAKRAADEKARAEDRERRRAEIEAKEREEKEREERPEGESRRRRSAKLRSRSGGQAAAAPCCRTATACSTACSAKAVATCPLRPRARTNANSKPARKVAAMTAVVLAS